MTKANPAPNQQSGLSSLKPPARPHRRTWRSSTRMTTLWLHWSDGNATSGLIPMEVTRQPSHSMSRRHCFAVRHAFTLLSITWTWQASDKFCHPFGHSLTPRTQCSRGSVLPSDKLVPFYSCLPKELLSTARGLQRFRGRNKFLPQCQTHHL